LAGQQKTLERVLRGTSDSNIRFEDLRRLLLGLGFDERIRGSHHMFSKPDVEELINLQRDGAKAKSYQVKQVRAVIVMCRLAEI
jgi:predicted RNA binding protein YcfA (HicA-like mRNA interferase family)